MTGHTPAAASRYRVACRWARNALDDLIEDPGSQDLTFSLTRIREMLTDALTGTGTTPADRLSAAAPDLLAACYRALDVLQGMDKALETQKVLASAIGKAVAA